jgi:hypothetical protein
VVQQVVQVVLEVMAVILFLVLLLALLVVVAVQIMPQVGLVDRAVVEAKIHKQAVLLLLVVKEMLEELAVQMLTIQAVVVVAVRHLLAQMAQQVHKPILVALEHQPIMELAAQYFIQAVVVVV